MSVVSRVARDLSLVAGGAVSARRNSSPAFAGEGDQHSWWRGSVAQCQGPSTVFGGPPPREISGRMVLPVSFSPTLSELFAAQPRDCGWIGFLLAQVDRSKPLL